MPMPSAVGFLEAASAAALAAAGAAPARGLSSISTAANVTNGTAPAATSVAVAAAVLAELTPTTTAAAGLRVGPGWDRGGTFLHTTTSLAAAAGSAAAAAAVDMLPLTPPPDEPASEAHVACQLLSSKFGWWLQVILGVVCFVSLVGKRFTDRIRRPWKIWFFDTSKQGFSAFLVHFLNILLSMAFGKWLDSDADPCNWYWINLTLDDTLGVGVQFLLLKLLQCIYRTKCVGRPELALCGEYGDPPNVNIFARQLLDWQCLVLLQKCFLAALVVNSTRQLAAVAAFLLGWLDPHPRAKLVVVMVFTPLTMNVFALWMADNFLQGDPTKAQAEQYQAHQSLVLGGSSPSVVGSRSPGDDISGDENDRVVGFQEWKKRVADTRHQPVPTRIPLEVGSRC